MVENEPPLPVPVISINRGGLPVTYLSAALESDTGVSYGVEPLVIGEFDPRVLRRYRWALIDDIGTIDGQSADALTRYLESGGNLLAFAGDRAAATEVLPVSGHALKSASLGTAPNRFLGVGQIQSGHPLLSRTEGWHSVNVSRALPVELLEGDEVLIRLENNEPFLVERRIGAGTLLLVLSSLDNRWNDLPVRPVFVSFMVEAARFLSGVNDISKTYTTGASLPLSLIGSASGQVVDPDGNTVLSLADTTRAQQIKLEKPGFYEVYTPEGSMLVAANVDPLESALAKIPQDLLEQWQDAAVRDDVGVSDESSRVATPPLELWHWLLMLLAIVIIAESMLGNAYLSPRAKGV